MPIDNKNVVYEYVEGITIKQFLMDHYKDRDKEEFKNNILKYIRKHTDEVKYTTNFKKKIIFNLDYLINKINEYFENKNTLSLQAYLLPVHDGSYTLVNSESLVISDSTELEDNPLYEKLLYGIHPCVLESLEYEDDYEDCVYSTCLSILNLMLSGDCKDMLEADSKTLASHIDNLLDVFK